MAMPASMAIVMVMVRKKNNIVRGIIGNGLAQITIKVIRAIDQLLLVPFFLTYWDAPYYGEWLTLSIIPSVLGFSDLGVGTAAGNSFVLAYASGDKQQAANIRKSGITVISFTILLGCILTIAVLFICSYFNLFSKSLIPVNESIIAVSLLMIARLFYFFNHLTEGCFRSARRAALGAFMYSGYSVMNIVVGLFALWGGCGVIGYAFSQFIVSILYTIFYWIVGNKQVDLKEYKGCLLASDIKRIIVKGLGYMMNPIWNSIYFQGSTFVVRVVLGAESVAVFNTMRTVCRSISQMFNVVNGSVLPELQYEYGMGNVQVVHRLFRISMLTSIAIGIIGTILLCLYGLDIYNLWTKNILYVSNYVWYTFVFGILFNGVWWTAIVAYSVTNKPYHFGFASIITACLSLAVSYLLSIHIGLWGAVMGTVLFDLIMMLYILPDSCHLLGMRIKDIFTHINEDYLLIKNRFVR